MHDHRPSPLPVRAHGRPRTTTRVPHIQCDQIPPPCLVEQLIQGVEAMSNIHERDSRMASPGVRAFRIPDESALGPRTAFIDDHEFCHIHPNGTIHLTAPAELRKRLIDLGWAEPHAMARAAILPETILLVYAPLTEADLSVVLWIVRQSMEFACGGVTAA